MTETTQLPPTLSPQTQASVQGLTRAKSDVVAWTHNLQQALADDVVAGRLTLEQAAEIAKENEVKAPPKPGAPAEAKETTAEANQAQLDAQTKEAEAEAAKDQKAAAAAQPKPEPEPEPPNNRGVREKDEKGPHPSQTQTHRR